MLSTGHRQPSEHRRRPGPQPTRRSTRGSTPAAYQQPADTTGTFGNVGRNTLRGPGQFNIDMSLIKITQFGRFNLELRAEAFNILNHPQFQRCRTRRSATPPSARSRRCCRTRRAPCAARPSATSSSRPRSRSDRLTSNGPAGFPAGPFSFRGDRRWLLPAAPCKSGSRQPSLACSPVLLTLQERPLEGIETPGLLLPSLSRGDSIPPDPPGFLVWLVWPSASAARRPSGCCPSPRGLPSARSPGGSRPCRAPSVRR